MKLSDAVDFLRSVAPRMAIPIHRGALAPAHRELHGSLVERFAPEGTAVLVPPLGSPVSV